MVELSAVEHLPTPSGPTPGTERRINGRDAGLALIHRLNGWLITGAVAGAGGLSLVAAHSFHGHVVAAASHTTGDAGPATVGSGSSVAGGASVPQSPSSAGGGLQPPATAPAPASSAPAPVVSGGS
jgi:hypothetical protein